MSSTPEIEIMEHPNFRTINVGSVYGALLDMRFEMIIYSQHVESPKALKSGQTNIPLKISRTSECRLIMDPFNLKAIAQWLMGQVDAFEKQYGHIMTAEERQQTASTETEDKDKKNTTNVYH
jgi:hypothetical protein